MRAEESWIVGSHPNLGCENVDGQDEVKVTNSMGQLGRNKTKVFIIQAPHMYG